MTDRQVEITTEYIKLEQLLKLAGACATGGAAKEAIRSGRVLVGDSPCTERGRKMKPGDSAEYDSVRYEVISKTQERA